MSGTAPLSWGPKLTTRPAQAKASVMTRIGVGRRHETRLGIRLRRASHGIGHRGRGHRLEGREVIAVFEDRADSKPSYTTWPERHDSQISFIRDYRYVRYVTADAELMLAPEAEPADNGAPQ